jgi:hypothetical protein
MFATLTPAASKPPADTTPTAPSGEATAAPTSDAPSEQANTVPASADQDKKLFVCTVCQKTFRLEAALQHHYQAKHQMEMPGTSTSAAKADKATNSASGAAGEIGANPSVTVTSADDSGDKSTNQYVHTGDGSLPQAAQYHLDVAPNAPEEGDIAVHWRCVNHTVLLGTVQDVQKGYVFEDPVLQFTLVTDFEAPSPGDPDKDFHTVRIFGESFSQDVEKVATEGSRVLVCGRLRMVPQFETSSNKFYHFPVVTVHAGTGTVSVA